MAVVFILLVACTSAVAFPVYSSSNGSVVVNTAYNGSLHLSAGSGTIVASSLFSADGGIGLIGTRLDEAYLQGVSGALSTLTEAAAAQAAVNANVTDTLAAVLGGLSALQASIGALAARMDAMEANTGLLDSLVVSPPMPPPSPPSPSLPSLPQLPPFPSPPASFASWEKGQCMLLGTYLMEAGSQGSIASPVIYNQIRIQCILDAAGNCPQIWCCSMCRSASCQCIYGPSQPLCNYLNFNSGIANDVNSVYFINNGAVPSVTTSYPTTVTTTLPSFYTITYGDTDIRSLNGQYGDNSGMMHFNLSVCWM